MFKEFLNADKINERSFDKDAIVDKGKSSNIAKLISGFQAIWFLMQCLGRWWTGLPLTLVCPLPNPSQELKTD